jgi:predicted 3-demethylubiquinone-9 3-methyltransferase (glyoxalase superfamily)
MQKITAHLWFDKEAAEAAEFYTSSFKDSKIKSKVILENTPSGSVENVTIELFGQEFSMMSAGPLFKFNPSVSFMIACGTIEEAEEYWGKLIDGGSVQMELGEYHFSPRYGWLQDKYGLSWQVYTGDQEITQKIIPTMMFVGDVCGKAEDAISFYTSIFKNSKIREIYRYDKEAEPDKEGTIAHAGFTLEGQQFAAMDSARMHDFTFNEAISFMVHCETQEKIDYYWEILSAVKEAEQCGWLKDKFGFSWQITPDILFEMLQDADKVKAQRVAEAFYIMKKFDIEKLKQAFEGK